MGNTIHATFADIIDTIIHYSGNTVPEYYKTKEVHVDNSDSAEKIADLFKTCVSFEILDEYIEFKIKKDQKELDEELEEKNKHLKYSIDKLKGHYNRKPEYKEEIDAYLIRRKLNWIIDEMNKKERK